jgi:hypothetical protein
MARGRQADWQLVILVITLLSGLLGGLLANNFWIVDPWWSKLVILAGTVIGTGAAFFLLTADRPETNRWTPQTERPTALQSPEPRAFSQPAFVPPPHPQPNRIRPAAQRGARPEPERQPAAEHARIVPLVPGGTPPPNGSPTRQWWADMPSAAPSNRGEPSALHRNPAPPQSSYDPESALIAQCPRCGEFRLDVDQVAPAYAFRCRNGNCGNTWNWTPGTPWPPVVVRRNLHGGKSDTSEQG